MIRAEFVAIILRVVHLLEHVDKAFEELRAILEIGEIELLGAYVQHHVVHEFLTLHRAVGIYAVESILLQNHEVDKLALPESVVILHRHAVVSQNVNLLVGLLAALHDSLAFVHLVYPACFDLAVQILPHLGIFQIFRVAVQRVDCRITLAVGTSLRKSIEASGRLFGGLGYRLFEITSGRRHRTYEGYRTRLAVGQIYQTRTGIETRYDCRKVHRERILTRKFFQTVAHLEMCIRDRCGVALVLMLFFNSPGKNLFVNFGSGLWNTYNNITGLLSDVLSYIRLFAIGLSGGVLALVFNRLAIGLTGLDAGFGDSSAVVIVAKIIGASVILLIGHGINLFMSSISSFVHPMRLTFVEFFKNAGFEMTSRNFEPLKKVKE